MFVKENADRKKKKKKKTNPILKFLKIKYRKPNYVFDNFEKVIIYLLV